MLLSQWQLINCQVKLEIGAPGGSDAKESAYSAETQVRSLCCKDPLEKEWATHSSILSWRIPWMEEPGGLQSMGLQNFTFTLRDGENHKERSESVSHVQLSATPWTVACQPSLSMGFSRQEYWSGLPYPPPGDLSDPGIEPVSLCLLHWQAGSLPLVPPGKPTRYFTHQYFFIFLLKSSWFTMLY